MGAYSPAPIVDAALERAVLARVIEPTLRTVAAEGAPYRGFLYAGLMIDGGEPRVLEYNVRLGDPETQPLLVRLASDLVPALVAVADGTPFPAPLEWDPRPAVCVVLAAQGYPGTPAKGATIAGLAEAARVPDVQVFHAGTARDGDRVVTAGGRVLGVTAVGTTLADAVARAYEAADCIRWDGMQYRRDIAHRALAR
jgi:phosphoribosylamine--glycine ligase